MDISAISGKYSIMDKSDIDVDAARVRGAREFLHKLICYSISDGRWRPEAIRAVDFLAQKAGCSTEDDLIARDAARIQARWRRSRSSHNS